jgi:16S rRNA (guanine527-N7)-methyltransferase
LDFSRIKHYFPDLSDKQYSQLQELKELYAFWNAQINVISRKDFDNFFERHVLHSLAIYKFMPFKEGTKILDVGTGGGFPGIPLAIINPDSNFHLVDTIGKKIKVVNEVVTALNLKNVTAQHCRAEQVKDKYDFIVSRAVTRMNKFIPWVKNKVHQEHNNKLANGILYLKGGDLEEELSEIRNYSNTEDISTYFSEEFFETKKVVYVKL